MWATKVFEKRSIVEVVAEGRADLRFGFNSGDEGSLLNDEEVRFLGRSEEPGQLHCLFSEDAVPWYPGEYDQFGE
jgi:hypothetical protein